MKAELKKKWLDALRSDKFTQITGRLTKDNGMGHCCLGVLCEVASLKRDGNEYIREEDGIIEFEDYSLSTPACEEFGLDYELSQTLAAMNDGLEGHTTCSFAEIADYIEANVPTEDDNV